MLAEIGLLATILAFGAAVYAILASLYGEQQNSEAMVLTGRNAGILTFPLLTVAVGALFIALMQEEYQIKYVWSVSSPSMPTFFRATALWGSQAGSLLFWSFLMSAFAAIPLIFNWHAYRRLMPYFTVFSMAVLVFFVGITLFIENPFERYWIVNNEVATTAFIPTGAEMPSARGLADSANGLNPLLRHFGMAIHPPMLYIGFVGFIIPFAYALAALASGDLSNNWIKAARRWTLIAWLALSLGLILGGRWAYDVLGWGGYWGWDPVENAAFLPWLIGTAFLHSVMIQEKRGMLKVWNMFLVIGTFSAVIFGTFATRSGLVESVHSFARSGIGLPMFAFWFSLTFISVALILYRSNRGELQDEQKLTSFFSREAMFLLNNFIFLALFIAVFWGSFGAPIISELFMDTNITLGADYFMRVTPPLFLLMYILMGIAPLSAWGFTSLRRLGRLTAIPLALSALSILVFIIQGMTTPVAIVGYFFVLFAGWVAIYETFRAVAARHRTRGENWLQATLVLIQRNPRRYGGYLVHLGVTIIGLGIIGSTLFQEETQQTLAVGESLSISDYQLRYDSFAPGQVSEDGRIMDIAHVSVIRNGREIAQISPRRDFFPEATDMNSMTIAGSHSTIENDFYVLLVGWEEVTHQSATFKVYINPLINLVWWGGIVLVIGMALSIWPKHALPASVRERYPVKATAGATA